MVVVWAAVVLVVVVWAVVVWAVEVWVVVALAVVARGLLIVLLRSGSAACAATRGRQERYAPWCDFSTRGVVTELISC